MARAGSRPKAAISRLALSCAGFLSSDKAVGLAPATKNAYDGVEDRLMLARWPCVAWANAD